MIKVQAGLAQDRGRASENRSRTEYPLWNRNVTADKTICCTRGTLVDGGRLEAAIEDEEKGASPLWPVFDVIWADPKVKWQVCRERTAYGIHRIRPGHKAWDR